MKAKPKTTKATGPAKAPGAARASAAAPAGAAKKMDIRSEVDRQLAEAKARRTGQRGAVLPAPVAPSLATIPATAAAGVPDRRGPGRPKKEPAGESRPPRRSPGRTARAAALAGVRDLATLAAMPFPTLTISEAAAILGCSNMHVSNCLDAKELVAVNIGKPGGERACNRILKASLESFIAKRGGAIPAAEAEGDL